MLKTYSKSKYNTRIGKIVEKYTILSTLLKMFFLKRLKVKASVFLVLNKFSYGFYM